MEPLGSIDFLYGGVEEAGAKRTRPEPEPAASGYRLPTPAEPLTSPTKRTSKKARVSRGAGPVDVTNKIANLAAMAKRAARSTATGWNVPGYQGST